MSLEEMESEAHSLLQICQMNIGFGDVSLSREIYRTITLRPTAAEPIDPRIPRAERFM